MSHLTIQLSPHAQGLRVHVSGPSSFENTVAYWRAIATELHLRPSDALLLIDELHGEPLSADDWLSLVLLMEGKGLNRLRIAHVKPLGLHDVEHCEIFARDAGIEARVFADERAGERWLTQTAA